MRAVAIPVAGPLRLVDIDGGLASLQQHVGGYVQTVPLPSVYQRLSTLWCDEDGQARSLPLNRTASRLAGQPILGPALLTGPANDRGDLRGLPPSVVDALGAVP